MDNSLKKLGYRLHSGGNCWEVRMRIAGRDLYFGCFPLESEDAAALAADNAALHLRDFMKRPWAEYNTHISSAGPPTEATLRQRERLLALGAPTYAHGYVADPCGRGTALREALETNLRAAAANAEELAELSTKSPAAAAPSIELLALCHRLQSRISKILEDTFSQKSHIEVAPSIPV